MSSVIDGARAFAIRNVKLRALPDLWTLGMTAQDALTIGLARDEYSASVIGNSGALVQQVIASADAGTGWAPWQRDSILGVASVDTLLLAAGELLHDVLAPLIGQALEQIKAAAVAVLTDILKPLTGLVGAIPLIGQAVQIVLGFVFAIVDLVKAAKASDAAQNQPQLYPPSIPDPEADRLAVEGAGGALDLLEGGDWSRLWLPLADIHDADRDWLDSFGCSPLTNGGFRLAPLAGHTFGAYPCYGSACYGFGAIPGTTAIHRWLQATGTQGKYVVDTGQWLPSLRSASLHAWSLLWADGPSSFAVDTSRVSSAWSAYFGELFSRFESLDGVSGGSPCSSYFVGRNMMIEIRKILGFSPSTPAADVLASMPPIKSMAALRSRQLAQLKRDTIAYVDADGVPPALRDEVENAQQALLESEAVCRIDVGMVPNQLFATLVGFRQAARGIGCTSPNTIQAPLKHSETLSGSNEPLPPGDPTPQPPHSPPPLRGSLRAGSGGGGLAVVGGLSLLAFLASRRKR